MRLSLLTLMLFACGDKDNDTAAEEEEVLQEDTSSESPEDTGQD